MTFTNNLEKTKTNQTKTMSLTGNSPSKSPEKLPSSDPFESDDIESVLAEAKEMVKPISSLSGKFSLQITNQNQKKKKTTQTNHNTFFSKYSNISHKITKFFEGFLFIYENHF